MSLESKRKQPQQQQQGSQAQATQQTGSAPANRPKPAEPDSWRGEGVVSTNHTD